MNVHNCRKCGKIFNYVVGPLICPACKDSMEAKFREVKEFVREHRTATMPEISESCDVDMQQIRQWIREERLQFADDSPIKMNCELCGAVIGTGRFCEKCKQSMAKELNGAIRKPVYAEPEPKKRQSVQNRMRFLDK